MVVTSDFHGLTAPRMLSVPKLEANSRRVSYFQRSRHWGTVSLHVSIAVMASTSSALMSERKVQC